MTTDNQLEPTDAEIDALNEQFRWDTTEGRRASARAVLARWGAQPIQPSAAEFALQALVAAGHVSQELVDKAMALPGAPQPAHSGEPVAYTVAGPVTDWSRDFSAYKTKTYVRPVFTAPKPVEREPLTPEQMDAALGSAKKVKPGYVGWVTDRELLEMAAKAYWGTEIDDVCTVRWLDEDQAIGYTHADNQDHNGCDLEFLWSPLTDDGDALRLAVKLGIKVEFFHSSNTAFAGPLDMACAEEEVDGDSCAATRRAIVRAAAEIGKAMPCA